WTLFLVPGVTATAFMGGELSVVSWQWSAGANASLTSENLGGEDGQLFAEDFGVVADIDGEGAEEEEVADFGGVRMSLSERLEFSLKLGAVLLCVAPMFGPGFDEDDGALLAPRAGADEGGAIDPGVLVEDRFAGNGEEST